MAGFRALLSTLLARWESSFDRAFQHRPGLPDSSDTASGEFISALIVDRRLPVRDLDGKASGRQLFD